VLKSHGAHNYSIFLHPETRQLFGYVEIEDEARWASIAATPECQRWWKRMGDVMPSNPTTVLSRTICARFSISPDRVSRRACARCRHSPEQSAIQQLPLSSPNMSGILCRNFVLAAALALAAFPSLSVLQAQPASQPSKPADASAAPVLRWLDGGVPAVQSGATWGMPWARGSHPKGTTFVLHRADGSAIPVQSWPLAYWPDGSLKWTAHAVAAGENVPEGARLEAGQPVAPVHPLSVREVDGAYEIDTGAIVARVAKTGAVLIPQVQRDGREILRNGRLVLLRQDSPEGGAEPELFAGEIGEVVLEQNGPVRAVVKIQGRHAAHGRAWMPFVVRLYFYAGGEAVRVMHTIIHDGDEKKDFIRGLGLRFDVPLRGELHDRHVRFSGEGDGLFGESVRTVTGLRRDPGATVRAAQIAGEATPPVDSWNPAAGKRMQLVPAFGDWSLFQSSADGFEINKRTQPGYSWLTSARGQRAGGLGYVGTPQGGVAFGIRNLWQSYPGELSIAGATGEMAEVTMWLWSPRAGAMDLRGYHGSELLDNYKAQLEAMEITYEDYEPGFDKPEGVARTSELYLWALAATPSRERLSQLAGAVRTPPC
jgi:hypothetical protein